MYRAIMRIGYINIVSLGEAVLASWADSAIAKSRVIEQLFDGRYSGSPFVVRQGANLALELVDAVQVTVSDFGPSGTLPKYMEGVAPGSLAG